MATKEREILEKIARDERTQTILRQLLGRNYNITMELIATGIAMKNLLENPEGRATLKIHECIERTRPLAEQQCKRAAEELFTATRIHVEEEKLERCIERTLKRLSEYCTTIYMVESTLTETK